MLARRLRAASQDVQLVGFTSFDPADISAVRAELDDNDNTVRSIGSDSFYGAKSVDIYNSGKIYFEAVCPSLTAGNLLIGLSEDGFDASAVQVSNDTLVYYPQVNGLYYNGSLGSGWSAAASGDIIGIAVDFDNDKLWISINGTWQNGDPSTNTGGQSISAYMPAPYCIVACTYYVGEEIQCNFGQSAFTYTVPTGFN